MLYLFADEAGNFDFSPKGTKYFIVASTICTDWEPLASELITLRHRLAYADLHELLDEGFHAAEEKQAVRDEVFKIIQNAELTIDVVVLDKSKTYPGIASNESYFYQLAWRILFKYVHRKSKMINALVVASSLGTRAKRLAFKTALRQVIHSHGSGNVKSTCWTAASHPCLQIADYCAWAIQRYYERADNRSFVLLEPKLRSCFEPFKKNVTTYY